MEYSYKTRKKFRLIAKQLPYEILVEILLEEYKAVWVSYELALLQNFHKNIPIRAKGSSSRLRINFPMEYS